MARVTKNIISSVDSANVEAVAPPLSGYVEVSGALQPFREDELVKITLGRMEKGLERLRKLLEHSARDAEAAKLNVLKHPPRVFDIKDQERRLRASVKSLDSLLSSDIKAKVLATERDKHKSIEDLAAGLVSLAEKLDDPAVEMVSNRVAAELKALKVAQKRVAEGGHAAFDGPTTRLIIELWCILDAGVDIHGICLRNKGILEDRIYALSFTWKSPLRRVLSRTSSLVPTKPGRGRPKSKSNKKNTKGDEKKGAAGSDGQPSPPPPAK